MTTIAELISEVRGHLDGDERGPLDTLDGAIDNVTTTVLLSDGSAVNNGDYLGIGFETVYVTDKPSTNQLTVLRNQDGSAAAAHSDGDLVRVRPRFTDARILAAINRDIQALPAEGLYRVKTLDSAMNRNGGIDLAADVLDDGVLAVRYLARYPSNSWVDVPGWAVVRDMPTANFASGVGLLTPDSSASGQTIRVSYKAPFAVTSATDANVESTTGLSSNQLEIVTLGAAVRLHSGRAVQRADAMWQTQPRREQAVTTSDVLNAIQGLRVLRAQRLSEEVSRLQAANPVRAVRRSL